MSTPLAPPMRTAPLSATPPIERATYQRLASRVKLLSWASLAYMTLEGTVAIVAGILAGSVALVGFGLDSGIEGFASVIIIWRFTGARVFSETAEHRAQKLVAIQFFILAPYVGYESVLALLHGDRPDVSWLGIALSASSVVVMPYLGIAKQRIADQISSAATKGEGRQNMLCAYLAGALLIGSARQRGRGGMVARSADRIAHRRGRAQGGPRGMERRGVRVHREPVGRLQRIRLRGHLLRHDHGRLQRLRSVRLDARSGQSRVCRTVAPVAAHGDASPNYFNHPKRPRSREKAVDAREAHPHAKSRT